MRSRVRRWSTGGPLADYIATHGASPAVDAVPIASRRVLGLHARFGGDAVHAVHGQRSRAHLYDDWCGSIAWTKTRGASTFAISSHVGRASSREARAAFYYIIKNGNIRGLSAEEVECWRCWRAITEGSVRKKGLGIRVLRRRRRRTVSGWASALAHR